MSEAEKTEIRDADDIWLGEQSVAGEEFVEALQAVRDVQDRLRDLKTSIEEMDTGLDRSDAIRLIYGRNSELTLEQVNAAFEVLDTIVESDLRDIGPRLLSMESGRDLNIDEAAEVWSDIVELAGKYGAFEEDHD